MLITFANTALRVLFATPCAACNAPLLEPLSGPVCAACWQGIAKVMPPLCERCGDVMATHASACCARCDSRPPEFVTARSAGCYEGTMRTIVHAFKYGGCRALAGRLAAMTREAGSELLVDADAVVPVPLHPWRRLTRGFNQADDLARGLGRPVARVLRRRRHGPPQASLPAGHRERNVERAFAIQMGRRRAVRGRVLVVVDDVMTTGATLNACSRVLLDAGARKVYALTAARAVAGRTCPPLPPPDLLIAARR